MWLVALFAGLLLTSVWSQHSEKSVDKRALQKEHEKPQAEKWMDKFHGRNYRPEVRPSLVNLIHMVMNKYMHACTPVILYDRTIAKDNYLLFKHLFRKFPMSFTHGEMINNTIVNRDILQELPGQCRNYLILLPDVMMVKNVLKRQNIEKVIIVSWSSQWRMQEFLSSEIAQQYVNLLIVGQSVKTYYSAHETYILYTHRLYVDGLGSSAPRMLTSWLNNSLVQRDINLFPPKMKKGFSGHRFIVSIANQPPFVSKRKLKDAEDGSERVDWEGFEPQLIKLISLMLNFTLEFKEAGDLTYGPGDSVSRVVKAGHADVGIAGLYTTAERLESLDMTQGYYQDCASFITLTSTALPKYRAIMGPFHWSVWLVLTFTYLFAILPLAYSDKHSFQHLIDNPGDIEDMFWYVFGTFTNCFTFSGEQSWSRSTKVTTRLLVGWYWAFTIIITACYTGSIIAFVTLPVYPNMIDTTEELIDGRYRIGTLDHGGWDHWFENSSDPTVTKLFKHIEYVPSVHAGLWNVTHAFFWSYAFLGSKANLDFAVRTNFTATKGKRSLLHIGEECFVPFMVSMALPKDSVYLNEVNIAILKIMQSGVLTKVMNDVKWKLLRSAQGKLLQAGSGSTLRITPPEDRALTLDDTQGMFLLLGAGFLIAAGSLISEYVGGCVNYCKSRKFLSRVSVVSNNLSFHVPTPRSRKSQISLEYPGQLDNSSASDLSQTSSTVALIVHSPPRLGSGIKVDSYFDEQDNEKNNMKSIEQPENNINSASDSIKQNQLEEIHKFDEIFGDKANEENSQ